LGEKKVKGKGIKEERKYRESDSSIDSAHQVSDAELLVLVVGETLVGTVGARTD
jgi:hypothetical protein